jgi:hypothetical protein
MLQDAFFQSRLFFAYSEDTRECEKYLLRALDCELDVFKEEGECRDISEIFANCQMLYESLRDKGAVSQNQPSGPSN